MNFRAFVRALTGRRPAARMLDGFVDSLLQTFENCRPGLADEALGRLESVESFFSALYEREKDRLVALVDIEHPHLSEASRREMIDTIDSRIRDVLIPAYARIAARFTGRERNDFYLTKGPWHGAERIAFGVGGMALGAFVVWAPFLPLWADEWVAVFALGGLVFPEARRALAFRRYVSDVNGLVERTDDEIFRMDVALLTREMPLAGVSRGASENATSEVRRPVPRARQGGR
jgi:hypothetical protein